MAILCAAMTMSVLHVVRPQLQYNHSFVVTNRRGDLILGGGAQVTNNPFWSIRSGSPSQHSSAAITLPLAPGVLITRVEFDYSYTVGYGKPAPGVIGTNFSMEAAGVPVYYSPHYDDHPYSKSHPDYSPPVIVRESVSIPVPASANGASRLVLHFDNNDRNIQLLLPLVVNVTCVRGPCAAPPAPPPPPPPPPPPTYQVFTEGQKTAENETIGCYRIPSLVRTSKGTLLAFAEGRVNGCRPDGAAGRPIVVRSSADDGVTWGKIRVAAPPNAKYSLNYPAASVLGDTIMLLFHVGSPEPNSQVYRYITIF